MENWKAILFLLAAGQGFLLSLALISQYKKPNKSNLFLGLILFVLSLEILFSWGGQSGYTNNPNAFPYWYFLSYLILPPSLWLFVQFNLNPHFEYSKKYLLLFIPAVIEISVSWFRWGMAKLEIIDNAHNLIDHQVWFLFAEVAPLLWFIYAMIFFGRKLFSVRKKVRDSSGPNTIITHLNKIYALFITFSILTVFWIILVFTDYDVFDYVEILLTTSLYLMGYLGYLKTGFFEVPRSLSANTNGSNSFSQFDDEKELNRLYQIMEENALYIQSNLSLSDVADELKLPSRYVSHLINMYHETNFRDFINSYRVKEVLRKINDPAEKHKTLLALAMEAGFNSKSTFNQVFKAHTGEVPSKYYQDK